jgi:aminopeptidase N
MLHTLRQFVNDDEKFRKLLRGLNQTFYHQTVTTQQVEKYLGYASGKDLTAFFNQYLRDTRIPVFEYKIEKNQLKYRWNNCVTGFNIPLKISVNTIAKWVYPTTDWQKIKIRKGSQVVVDVNFYVKAKDLNMKD